MHSDTLTFYADDGLSIHVFKWLPEPGVKVKAVVQLHHGMAEHAARYVPLAEALTKAGLAVYASDHRGHGRSVRSEEDLGFFAQEDGWNKAVADMRKLNGIIKEAHPGLPHLLVAHSMGSLMGQHYIIEHGDTIDGAAFSGSNGKVGALADVGRLVARIERKRLGRRGRSKVLQMMSFGSFNKPFEPARTKFEWLSRDPAQVDKYIADPLCGFICTTQLWVDLLAGLKVIEDPAQQARVPRNLPIYIFAGDRDPVSNGAKNLRQLIDAYKAAGLTRVTHKFYPDARHEVFNETNRSEVQGDLIAWIERLIA